MCIEITHIQGGMREFERTGIYPEYLLFNLPTAHWCSSCLKFLKSGGIDEKDEVVNPRHFEFFERFSRKFV